MVYLAPVPTFYRILWKNKSTTTQGFQAVPYVVIALLSAMLRIYYALIKTNNSSFLLITINGFGVFIHTVYITLFLFFGNSQAPRISVLKLILSLNVVTYSLIVALTLLLLKGSKRVMVVGMINLVFSLSVSIIRDICTTSAEFMPLPLSFTLIILRAIAWFFYGLLIKDRFVAASNIVRLGFGVARMVIYAIYRNTKPALCNLKEDPEKATCAQCHEQPELVIVTMSTTEVHPIETELQVGQDQEGEAGRQSPHGDMMTGGGEGRAPPVAEPYEILLNPPHP